MYNKGCIKKSIELLDYPMIGYGEIDWLIWKNQLINTNIVGFLLCPSAIFL